MPQVTSTFEPAFKQGYLQPSNRAFRRARDFAVEPGERPSPDWPPSAVADDDQEEGQQSPIIVLLRLTLNRKGAVSDY